jgi:hypothetical protein
MGRITLSTHGSHVPANSIDRLRAWGDHVLEKDTFVLWMGTLRKGEGLLAGICEIWLLSCHSEIFAVCLREKFSPVAR